MVREIITFPIRVGARATLLGVRVSARAAGVALGITRRLVAGSVPGAPHGTAPDPREPSATFAVDVVVTSPPPSEAAPPVAPAPEPARAPAAALETPPVPETQPVPEIPPVHVSEDVQFVEAFAEPGAEEGAGAEVHIKEPWRDYAQMTADDVIARLAEATPEEIAAVELYEGVHRRRKTVLAQAKRQLRSATVTGPVAQARPA
jgi:hypothetical protein